MRLQRLNWAGLKIEVGETTLLVDAIEGAPDWNSGGKAIIPLSAGTGERHAVITHAHTDHYDPLALQAVLNKQGTLVCHSSVARTIHQSTLRIQQAELYEPVLLNWQRADIMAIAVPASDGWGDPQVAWIIDGGGKRIIHCGDTIWHGHWWNIARHYGPFDLACVPINGVTYERGRFSGSNIPATLTPEQAVTAAKLLQARRVCPIHYDMDDDPGHYVAYPDALKTFLTLAEEQHIPSVVLEPGEWVNWETLH